MSTDRDTALRELAIVVAEATVDAWLADKVADSNSSVTPPDDPRDDEKTMHTKTNSSI